MKKEARYPLEADRERARTNATALRVEVEWHEAEEIELIDTHESREVREALIKAIWGITPCY